jgi:hypothetical protein
VAYVDDGEDIRSILSSKLEPHCAERNHESKRGDRDRGADGSGQRAVRRASISDTPTVSANGTRDGIVWVLRSKVWNGPNRPAVLYAYNAMDVTHQLYNSEQDPERGRAGLALRFNIPTVVNGHVYVGAKHEVDVWPLIRSAIGE